jgi:hypothetical protein
LCKQTDVFALIGKFRRIMRVTTMTARGACETLPGGTEVPRENIAGTRSPVVEKAIRRLRMGPILTCPGDAFRAGTAKLLEDRLETSDQPLVFELRRIVLISNPC